LRDLPQKKRCRIRVKCPGLPIYKKLHSLDAEELKAAMGEYLELVDQFYEDNKYYLAPQQYETAKKIFE
jgi:hypothetical protein